MEKPREYCGVIGVYLHGQAAEEKLAAQQAWYGLFALQHRGQEAAGIASWQGRIAVKRGLGLVSEAIHRDDLLELASDRAIGHVRYSTTGTSSIDNAGPVTYTAPGSGRHVAVAHNGNLVNSNQLREQLAAEGIPLHTESDTEVLAAIIATHGDSAREGIKEAMRRAEGAYSLTILAERKIFCCRDPHGIRPLVIGMLEKEGQEGYVVASETCALDLLGARYLQDVAPGQLLTLNAHGLQIDQVFAPSPTPCSFEAIYFARPDSRLGAETVYDIRTRLGAILAREYPADADAVVEVPDSGHCMALGFANASGIPMEDGLIKNRYINRTFIEPTNHDRQLALRRKFNALPSAIAGKRIVVVDDSLIRGNTIAQIIGQLREAGAIEVHVRIGAPPARHPCWYGIDMGQEGDYIATDDHGERRSAEEIATMVGADSLHYLSLGGLAQALKRPLTRRCTACFDGEYPIAIPPQTIMDMRAHHENSLRQE